MSNANKTPPGHDIFCTPENRNFHSKILYKALDASRQEIRLLSVLPDDGGKLIKCELLQNMPLREVQGQYLALSYCAGDVHKTGVILVDGVKCNVFANLRHALAAARYFFKRNTKKLKSKDSRFLLWVDQICINQYDLAERSHQVGFMTHIYQYAQQTLICLSTSKSKARGMKWLLRLCKDVPFLNVKSWGPIWDYLRANVENERFTNGWISLYDMLESPWWNRAWVFQEFIASSAVSFLYWRCSASWEDVSAALHLFCESHVLLTNRSIFLGSLYELGGPQDRQLCRIIDRIKRTNAREAVETVFYMVRAKLGYVGGFMDLKLLLGHSQNCKASDARDRVFAFLGLASPCYGVIPNYSLDNDLSTVLIETSKRIILFEDSLDVLCYAQTSSLVARRTLPSWVIDWTYQRVSIILNDDISKFTTWSPLEKIKKTNANASFHNVKTPQWPYWTVALEVCGVFVDKLAGEEIDWEPTPLFLFEALYYRVNVRGQAQFSDQLWILDGALTPTILRREHHGYRLIGCATTDPMEDGLELIGPFVERLVEAGHLKRERILII